jgi:hypothetical protein
VCHHGAVRRLGLLAATIVAALLIASAASFARQRRALNLHIKTSSIVVDGSHFKSHERVKVKSSTGGSANVRASSSGAFSVTLRGAVDRCSGVVVVARGSAGSLVMIRRPPLPACAPMRGAGGSA